METHFNKQLGSARATQGTTGLCWGSAGVSPAVPQLLPVPGHGEQQRPGERLALGTGTAGEDAAANLAQPMV